MNRATAAFGERCPTENGMLAKRQMRRELVKLFCYIERSDSLSDFLKPLELLNIVEVGSTE